MDNVLGMIGLARRARKTVNGTMLVLEAVKSREAMFVVIACDASANTKKAITDSCRFYNIDYAEYSNKSTLGKCVGGGDSSSVAVLDMGFAKAIESKIKTAIQ